MEPKLDWHIPKLNIGFLCVAQKSVPGSVQSVLSLCAFLFDAVYVVLETYWP